MHRKYFSLSIILIIITGCTHNITINPPPDFSNSNAIKIDKNVVYVMSDSDRIKEVTTQGGSGETVKYFPYRDLEMTIRETLKLIYKSVSVINTPNDTASIKQFNASYIFAPEITTSSSSPSSFTWPPTKFSIEMILNITNINGDLIARPRAIGNGFAEFSEFKNDFGLAGKRAASDLAKNLQQEIKNNPKLRDNNNHK